MRNRNGSRSSSEFLGVDFAAELLDPFENATLRRRELLDFFCELLRIAEHFPRCLERERNRRSRRAAEVVTGDRAHGLERRLREERTHPLRVFAFPRTELHEIRGGEDELYFVLSFGAREHEPTLGERLERGRHRIDDEHALRFGDAVEQLHGRVGQTARIAEVGQCDERSRDLLLRIESLRGIDAHAEPRHEVVHLGLRQCLEDVHKAERRTGLSPHDTAPT